MKTTGSYPIQPVPFTAVQLKDSFWAPKIRTNHQVTIPIAIQQCYQTGRVDNFLIAAGIKDGSFCTQYPFDDTDIYKLVEAASYSLQNLPDAALEAQLDTLISYVGQAQEPDGYLYTNRTINPAATHEWAGPERWTKDPELSHELYNSGHLFEAAVAHWQATGKTSLLDIAKKNADLLVQVFLEGQKKIYPGHQIVEMGLVRLYEATRHRPYLDLAKYFLDVRGPGGNEYNQAHQRVVDQTEAVGHAVRATYMYSGMADIAAMYQDPSYIQATKAIWENLVAKKTYLTGGIGSGSSNEGFDPDYVLPNMSAYCETCASIGSIFWNQRMFLHAGEGKYIDVLERTLYNAMLSGVSLSGDRFFYPNALESAGQHERSAWFGCACCPPNVARLLPSLPGYLYATGPEAVYVNLFAESQARFEFNGSTLELAQTTRYPWDGRVELIIGLDFPKDFKLCLRIPGWARNEVMPGGLYHYHKALDHTVLLKVNGQAQVWELRQGYAVLNRTWKAGDTVTLDLPMAVRQVQADPRVAADRDRIAIERGPLVYCAESPYVADGKVLNLVFDPAGQFSARHDPQLLGGVVKIVTQALPTRRGPDGSLQIGPAQELSLIPYHLWNNHGPGEMAVWLPVNDRNVRPIPQPTIASSSRVSASIDSRSITALNDQYQPASSSDHSMPYLHWWPKKDCQEWVQYDFDQPLTVSRSKVYWYDDRPFGGCRLPDSWELLYKAGEDWLPVPGVPEWPVRRDAWCAVEFPPLVTTALRLVFRISREHSAGIHEWVVQ